MHFSILSDLKKTTAVVESLSTASTRCSVTEITSLLQDTLRLFSGDDHFILYNVLKSIRKHLDVISWDEDTFELIFCGRLYLNTNW